MEAAEWCWAMLLREDLKSCLRSFNLKNSREQRTRTVIHMGIHHISSARLPLAALLSGLLFSEGRRTRTYSAEALDLQSSPTLPRWRTSISIFKSLFIILWRRWDSNPHALWRTDSFQDCGHYPASSWLTPPFQCFALPKSIPHCRDESTNKLA